MAPEAFVSCGKTKINKRKGMGEKKRKVPEDDVPELVYMSDDEIGPGEVKAQQQYKKAISLKDV